MQAKEATLLSILRSIEQLERERTAKQEELRSPQAEGRQEEITQQLQDLRNKLETLRKQLNTVATGLDPDVFALPKDALGLDWQQRVLEILRPVFNELERLTARPREIDRLRTAMASYQEQQRLAEQALDNLQQLAGPIRDPALAPYLLQLQHDWERRRQEVSTQLSIARQQLEQKLAEQTSLVDSIRHLFQLFFRSRGRNLLLAGLAGALCWLLFHWLHSWIRRVSPVHRRGATFAVRLFDMAYTGWTVLGAILAFQLVLYLLDDWLLLMVSLLFLVGFVWTSRTMLPRFWGEVLLMLDLGTIREGERVLYNGVPWRVHSLYFYTRLVNPVLAGGDLRLALRDCLSLRSRVCADDEPWFPTRHGD
jgi:predicted  nucleic acid-binding Zn-ribbon protein